MLVRHQADATTQAYIDQASGMPGGRRASQERLTRFDALNGRTASLAWRGSARPDDPSRAEPTAGLAPRRGAPTGAKIST